MDSNSQRPSLMLGPVVVALGALAWALGTVSVGAARGGSELWSLDDAVLVAAAGAGAATASYLCVVAAIATACRLAGASLGHWSLAALPLPLRRAIVGTVLAAGAASIPHPATAVDDAGWIPRIPAAPAAIAAPTPVLATPQPRVHRVEPGQSLWRITARLLGPDASDGDISRQWPALYAANRDVIGPNPGHIEPGQLLTIPAELLP